MTPDPRLDEAVRLHGAGRYREAEAFLRAVLAADPRTKVALTALGNTLKAQRRFDEAVDAHLRALEVDQGFVEAWSNLGLTYQAAGKLDEAVVCCQQAVARRPDVAALQHNLGNALLLRGDFEGARAGCADAVAANPGFVPAHITLGNAFKELGRIDEAVATLRAALRLSPADPDVHWNLGLVLLLAGRFAEGWEEIEWRAQIPELGQGFTRTAGTLWKGEALAESTLALVAEQGLGDTLQFVRYAPLAAPRVRQVVLSAPAKLRRLLSGVPGMGAFAGFEDQPRPQADAFAPLFSLPRLCGPLPTGIASPPHYLAAESALVEEWAHRLGPRRGLRVGIAWQGNPRYRADRRRSIALSHLAPLLRLPDVEALSFQKGFGAEQLQSLPPELRPRDLGSALDNGPDAFVETAAALMNVDLLITSDTSLPHLAGALGCEVWLLLPAVPDWRWGLQGDRTPWYPSMRLFRQTTPGDWGGVITRVAAALDERRRGLTTGARPGGNT